MSIRTNLWKIVAFVVVLLITSTFWYPSKKTLNNEEKLQIVKDEAILEYGPYGSIGTPTVVLPSEPDTIKELVVAKIDPWDDKRYKEVWTIPNKEELRGMRFGVSKKPKPLLIKTMKDGQVLDAADLEKTIVAVLNMLPHVKTNKDVIATVQEIFMAETCLGQYTTGSGQFGLAQYRLQSAQHLLEWTKLLHEDVYDSLMSFYDKKKSLKDNLITNVPFNIAMCVTYFLHLVPDYRDRIATREDRAILWKVAYNTHLGEGTVNKYLQRCAYAERKGYAGFASANKGVVAMR